jgi:formate dehydrogenase major subunit
VLGAADLVVEVRWRNAFISLTVIGTNPRAMPRLSQVTRYVAPRRSAPRTSKMSATRRSLTLLPRTSHADRVVRSICPYCGVGCGQLVYVQNERITNIEGNPDSPISEGCLCPKGSATYQLVTGAYRVKQVLYRRPFSTHWEALPLERAMDMVAERVRDTRDATWQDRDDCSPSSVTRRR